LGKDLIPDPERAFHPFPAEDHSLGLGGADSHPSMNSNCSKKSGANCQKFS